MACHTARGSDPIIKRIVIAAVKGRRAAGARFCANYFVQSVALLGGISGCVKGSFQRQSVGVPPTPTAPVRGVRPSLDDGAPLTTSSDNKATELPLASSRDSDSRVRGRSRAVTRDSSSHFSGRGASITAGKTAMTRCPRKGWQASFSTAPSPARQLSPQREQAALGCEVTTVTWPVLLPCLAVRRTGDRLRKPVTLLPPVCQQVLQISC